MQRGDMVVVACKSVVDVCAKALPNVGVNGWTAFEPEIALVREGGVTRGGGGGSVPVVKDGVDHETLSVDVAGV